MKKTTNVTVLTSEEVKALLTNETLSKSAKVKTLFDAGFEIKDIAQAINIRYNFAYNVIQNYAIQNDIELTREGSVGTKKNAMWELFDTGKTMMEVAKELKMPYNSVWKAHKDWAEAAKKEVEQEEQVVAENQEDLKTNKKQNKKLKKVVGA